MPSLNTIQYPKPTDDTEFQEMIRDLFALHWNDDNALVYGRSGQGQNGVDVFGNPNKSTLNYGIQCKVRKNKQLTKKDIEKEIEQAKCFIPKLDVYIFVTTTDRDKTLQDLIKKISDEEKSNNGFEVQIKFWEDVVSLFAEYPNIAKKYYPQFFVEEKKLKFNGYIDADNNVIIDAYGNNLTIINLKEAAQYKAIEAEIADFNAKFNKTQAKIEQYPEDDDFRVELLEIDKKRGQKQADLETLKKEVLKLAEDFQRIPINTERLRKAKAYFDKGEFAEARAVFNAEIEIMDKELAVLLVEKQNLSQKTTENQEKLVDKANEFLLLARLTAMYFDSADRFEKTVVYYEKSLKAVRDVENLFAFAKFLQEHNQFERAQPLYEETLAMYRNLAKVNPQIYLPDVAANLNNLALLQQDTNEFDKALANYKEALKIYRELEVANPQIYLPNVARTLNNLAVLQQCTNEFDKALANYEAALKIRRGLALANPQIYLPAVAVTLNSLALLQQDTNEFDKALTNYEAALQIYTELTIANPQVYLPDMATMLSNLAILQQRTNKFGEALANCEEALKIRRRLAAANPQTYLHSVAVTLNNLAILQQRTNKFEEALANCEEALEIRRDLAAANPQTYLPAVAMTLNNLATLQRNTNEFDKALVSSEAALKIYRQFAAVNPQTYLPNVAAALNNLAILQKDKNKFGESLATHKEALQLYSSLATANPQTYLPDVAMILSNLADLQRDINDSKNSLSNYEAATEIFIDLAAANPQVYLPDVARTLNNLAVLQQHTNELEKALANYEKALKIRRDIALVNPQTYLPAVAATLANLSIFYLQSIPDKEKSIGFATEAIDLLLPIYEQAPHLEKYLDAAIQILIANGVDVISFLASKIVDKGTED